MAAWTAVVGRVLVDSARTVGAGMTVLAARKEHTPSRLLGGVSPVGSA